VLAKNGEVFFGNWKEMKKVGVNDAKMKYCLRYGCDMLETNNEQHTTNNKQARTNSQHPTATTKHSQPQQQQQQQQQKQTQSNTEHMTYASK